VALILSLTFIAFAVIGRILIQFWTTGDHGLRFASLRGPLKESVPGSAFVMSFVASFILIVMSEAGFLEVSPLTPKWIATTFFLVGLAGIAITLVAQWQMGIAWRIGVDQREETTLITRGLYRRSRNPIYFGIFLYWIGITATLPHPAVLVCALVCWISIEVVVRQIEEPYLKRIHGDAFGHYYLTTNRYLIWSLGG